MAAAVLITALAGVGGSPSQALVPSNRLAGTSRFATAVAISKAQFPRGAVTVYLARAYPPLIDALVGGALTDGPILLVPEACGDVPDAVAAEIDRLEPSRVVALGGTGAICDATLTAAAAGRSQGRLSGHSRYETAVAIALAAFPEGADVVYLARGEEPLVDALAGGTLTGGPTLLVPGCAAVPGVVADAITTLDPQRVVALGGFSTVCDEVLTAAAAGRPTGRLSGKGRFDTAIAISQAQFPDGAERVYLARAYDPLVDALAGGVLTGGPILLVPECGELPAQVAAEIKRLAPSRVTALGGAGAICDDVLAAAGAAAPDQPCWPAPVGVVGEAEINPLVYQAGAGTLRAQMLFVDFPNAPAPDATSGYYDILAPAMAWFQQSSYGRHDLQITPFHQWLRMPHDDTYYGVYRGSPQLRHQEYIADALAAADPLVDFSDIDVVYVVPPSNADHVDYSPTWNQHASLGITVDGHTIHNGVTFGQDLHYWGFKVLNHETGHMLGLPDLYDYDSTAPELSHRHAGGWDIMGLISGHSPDLLGWHKRLLGWLDQADIRCVDGAGTTDVELQPLAAQTGVRMAVVPLGDDVSYGIEYRDGTGLDASACSTGVLIYRIDQRVSGGHGPVEVQDASPGTSPSGGSCKFDLDDAAYGAGLQFADASAGITVDVLSVGATATIRVTRAAAAS